MKISYQWLKRYIALTQSSEELKDILTFSGIEVEAVEELKELPASIISARVLTADPVPDSDHLQICAVDTGSETIQVICGAANCHSGMIAVLALPGTKIGDFVIKKAKIRGIESAGMLCSEKELNLSDNHDGIIELDADTQIGISVNSIFELPDTVFELEITPNRSDLLGYLGIARDLSASTNIPLVVPDPTLMESKVPASDTLHVSISDTKLCPRYTARVIKGVKIGESPLWLKNYLAKSGLRPINNVVDITNYVMLETGHPLHAFDLKCLSSSSDIKQIVVRNAQPGEVITALDAKTYELDEQDLVIADEFKPVAIAGVIGGVNSQIDNTSVDVVIESAAFDPGSVRRTSYKHKINTDSSYRFERHLSEYATEFASLRATELILCLAGGSLCKGSVDVWPSRSPHSILGIRPSRFEKIIGYRLEGDRIIQYLSNLGLQFVQYANWKPGLITDTDDLYCFHTEQIKQGITEFSEDVDCEHTIYFRVPHYRIDLEREIDLIEELARLDGYDKTPRKTAISLIMDRHTHAVRRMLQDTMVCCGAHEVVNFSFEDPEHIGLLGFDQAVVSEQILKLKNPQSSNQSVMRTSLLPQLIKTMEHNLNHGQRDIRIFELNKTYLRTGSDTYTEPYRLTALFTGTAEAMHWQSKSRMIDFYDVKGYVSAILEKLMIRGANLKVSGFPYLIDSIALSCVLKGAELLHFGKLKPEIAAAFGIDLVELKQELWLIDLDVEALVTATRNLEREYEIIPKYPSVERDISFIISDSVSYEQIRDKIVGLDDSIIQSVQVFDEYRGKQVPQGMRSLSLHLIFNDSEKTLTVTRIDQLVESIQKMLLDEWQIKTR